MILGPSQPGRAAGSVGRLGQVGKEWFALGHCPSRSFQRPDSALGALCAAPSSRHQPWKGSCGPRFQMGPAAQEEPSGGHTPLTKFTLRS